MDIQLATSDAQIAGCFAVMAELRPHLVRDEFVERVRLQERENFLLAYGTDAGRVVAVAGFRVMEKLSTGRSLYVDDLVTSEQARSHGYGHALFEWLVHYARARQCRHFELDSGVQRFDAHRFYLRERMIIRAHHFDLEL